MWTFYLGGDYLKPKVEQKVCMSVSLNTCKTNRNAKWMSKVKSQIIYLLDDVENYFIMIGLEQANILLIFNVHCSAN